MSNTAPIGVFDSGMGGLTVVREMMSQLPNESIIYFGDTARVPYGPKSPDTVLRYSREITSYLKDEGVKALVVACNTATAHALPALREEFDLPIVGVIEPGARAAVSATKTRHVGVIGTAGTIKSGAYEKEIKRLLPEAAVTAQACALFVPLVEEGWVDTEPTRAIARNYLIKPRMALAIGSLPPMRRILSSASRSAFLGHRLIELRHTPWVEPSHSRSSIASSVSLRKVGASSHEPAFAKTPPLGIFSRAGTCECP